MTADSLSQTELGYSEQNQKIYNICDSKNAWQVANYSKTTSVKNEGGIICNEKL